jgi:hypothetical protein
VCVCFCCLLLSFFFVNREKTVNGTLRNNDELKEWRAKEYDRREVGDKRASARARRSCFGKWSKRRKKRHTRAIESEVRKRRERERKRKTRETEREREREKNLVCLLYYVRKSFGSMNDITSWNTSSQTVLSIEGKSKRREKCVKLVIDLLSQTVAIERAFSLNCEISVGTRKRRQQTNRNVHDHIMGIYVHVFETYLTETRAIFNINFMTFFSFVLLYCPSVLRLRV